MAGEAEALMLVFGLCAISLDYLIGIMLVRRISAIKEGSKRKYYLSLAGFFLAHGTFVLTHVINQSTPVSALFNLGVLLVLAGVVLLVYAIELTVYTRSKYFFTIFGAIAVGIIAVDQFTRLMVLGIRLMEWPQYFANPLLVLFIVLVYLNAFRKASGPAKRNALFMILGIISFMVAELALSNAAKVLLPWAKFVGPPLRVVAVILLSYGIMHLSVWKAEVQQQAGTIDAVPKQP
jgi:hypothetical protein